MMSYHSAECDTCWSTIAHIPNVQKMLRLLLIGATCLLQATAFTFIHCVVISKV